VTTYGYCRISTADQNPDHQIDALMRAGVERENIYLDRASGAKASRPELDKLLAKLTSGDMLKITRLDRLSRSVQHLINLGADLRARRVGLHVIEQGIDTETMEGRAMFGMLAVLAELQRELIVSNTNDGLAAARARGRVGGRRPKLNQRQLDQAQKMYDSGEHTVEEIADTFNVSRPTMYRHLTAHHEGRNCALIVYRNGKPKTDASNRRLGETGQGDEVQLEADRKWWPIAPARRPRVKAIVYVHNGTVVRVRSIDPDPSKWREDDRGYADVPVSRKPLDDLQIAEQLPTLGIRNGDSRPHVRGKIREYIVL
jgi:DNA invertase Pin-like site-specific DNA recombinase